MGSAVAKKDCNVDGMKFKEGEILPFIDCKPLVWVVKEGNYARMAKSTFKRHFKVN